MNGLNSGIAFTVLLLLSSLSVAATPSESATPPDPNYVNALWVAESGGILKVATADGTVLFQVNGAGEVRAVAADPRHGVLWAFEGGTLRGYGFDGKLRSQTAVPVDNADEVHFGLAVDPTEGRVWLGQHSTLYAFDANGTLESRSDLTDVLQSLTYDSDRQVLWAATQGSIAAYDSAGQASTTISVGKGEQIQAIDYAPALHELWVATRNSLLRYNANGQRTFSTQAGGITHLAADGHGFLWFATPQALSRMDSSGALLFELAPFDGVGTVIDLVADPADRSAWAASEKGLAQVDSQGVVRHRLDFHGMPGFGRVRGTALYSDTISPELSFTAPSNGSFLNNAQLPFTLKYSDIGSGVNGDTLRFEANYADLSVACTPAATTATCTPSAKLPDGDYTVTATVGDHAGNRSKPAELLFTIDTVPPAITLTTPVDRLYTNSKTLTVAGSVNEPATVNVNGVDVSLDVNRVFSHNLTLSEGSNPITVMAVDRAGNKTTRSLTVALDTVPPAAPVLDGITTEMADGSATVTGSAGSVEAGARVTITNTRTGQSVTVTAGADGSFTASLTAQTGDTFTLVLHDAAGNASASVSVDVGGGTVVLHPIPNYAPPDPATIAPSNDPTVATSVFASTAFLYSGPNAIQHQVAPDTIEARRVAVLRGKASTRDGKPLPGVTITVLGHSEFGWTGTGADGHFDMAVNGGGYLTVQYAKAGYLPVERQINAPWQDWAALPGVVMIPVDSQVTSIDLSSTAAMQVARGSVVKDSDGTRQATLLFPQGTRATMVMPDGSTQPLTTLNVRATEYTVGSTGLQAMPGPLPPTSAYTYAVEFSADQALAASAKSVTFSQPVPIYVDNFLNFPAGIHVPLGWYDPDKAAWIPYNDGRVIKILSITGGLAVLDVDGQGQPATDAELTALGISDAERAQLASLYAPGKTLWRVAVSHFSSWDENWPYGAPDDAQKPDAGPPDGGQQDNPCTVSGSIIECENQVLGEAIPIAGTPFHLNYRSNRVPGRKATAMLQIPLSGSTVPASLVRIDLNISIAGHQFSYSFAPAANQSYTFTWDGKDAFGRPVQGKQSATIHIGYVYPAVYEPGGDEDLGVGYVKSFALAGGAPISSNITRKEVTFWQDEVATLEQPDFRGAGLGGWTLDPHHSLEGNVLYRGDGARLDAQAVGGRVIMTVAGNGTAIFSGDGGPATQAALYHPRGVEVAADGSLYILDSGHYRIRKVSPDGIITTVAGIGGFYGVSGDGGPATQAGLSYPSSIAVGPEGSLYIADYGLDCIRKVSPDGIITTVAGNGSWGFSGDGGPATQAELYGPESVAVGPDGSLYIGDFENDRIRKVSPDGIIATVAGNGSWGFSGDGGPATQAELRSISEIAVGPDGSLYIPDAYDQRVRKVSPDGIITTVAGTGGTELPWWQGGGFSGGFSGDGGPATQAALKWPGSVAVGPDGSLYIGDWGNLRVRKVSPDGIITTVAGNGSSGFSGDGGFATQAELARDGFDPSGVAIGPDGSLYIADSPNNRIRRVATVSLGVPGVDMSLVPSDDGQAIYVFDTPGRHLRTIDAITGALRHQFQYDENGRLIKIEDDNGNATTIERDSSDMPTAIVAPDGRRTRLTLDPNGYLASITDPAGNTYAMTSTSDGLLTSFTDPNGHMSTFTYDDTGLLLSDHNAAGGGWNLARTTLSDGYEVSLTSAEGRTNGHRVEHLPTHDTVRTGIAPDGATTRSVIGSDGKTTTTAPDGTITVRQDGADPRFGMSAPVPVRVTVTTPAGLVSTSSITRTANLDDSSNLFSATTLTETVTKNGRTSKWAYSATSHAKTLTTPTGRIQTDLLDSHGRVVRDQLGDLAPTSYTYDTRGRLTGLTQGSNGDRPYAFTYDAAGNLATLADPLSRTASFSYDPAGRLTAETLPGGATVHYTYDAKGNLTALVPPGRTAHLFTYTVVDQKADYTPPALNGVDTITRYSYDKDKNLTQITRPDGSTVDMTYDTGGHLANLTDPQRQVTYSYNAATGQLKQVSSSDGSQLAYTYDGFLPLSETESGMVSGSVSRSYDKNFWVTSLAVNGQAVSFGYDADGLLTRAGSLSLSRDARNGLLTGTTLGAVETARTYNPFGELQSETVTVNGSPALTTTYTRDALGRITEKQDTPGATTTVTDYSYDAAGRLAQVKQGGAVVASYTYDANGNRLSAATPDGTQTGTYDAQDRMISYGGATCTYTANGDLATKTENGATTTYTYDALGNLTEVKLPDATIDYLIDARNRRVGKKVNGTLVQGFLYQDQLNPVAELNGSGNLVARFVYGSKANVPDYMVKGGRTYRIISDHLGSPRLVIDTGTGTVVQRMDYDAFGNVIRDTSPEFQPFGFAGGLYDSQSGLVRFGARDYDPTAGRWTSKDPIGFNGGDTGLYTYVLGNPLSYVDPHGTELSTGVVVHSGTVNPFTSNGGGVDGYNYQSSDHYTYTGSGLGLDVGASVQSVWAFGSGAWTGEFSSVNLSAGIFSFSIFWSPGEGGWAGFTYGLGIGLPGVSYENTNYKKGTPFGCMK